MEVVYNVKYKFKNNENKTNEELKEKMVYLWVALPHMVMIEMKMDIS